MPDKSNLILTSIPKDQLLEEIKGFVKEAVEESTLNQNDRSKSQSKSKTNELQLFSVSEVMKLLKLSRISLYKRINSGAIGHIKEGTYKFTQSHINLYIETYEKTAK